MTSAASPADEERRRLLALFATELYGPIPPLPDHLEVRRVRHAGYQRLELGLAVEERRFAVHAALWLPAGPGPAPLIVGLDFLGPIGVLQDSAFPIDRDARIEFRGSTVLDATLRGRGADRWPVDLIQAAGFGLLLSCYGSWVPDDPAAWRDHGLAPLLRSPPETGAIALWAWALSRLVDVALTLPEVDATRIHLAGHSRLGKAALWAAACGRARRRRHRQQQRLRGCRAVATCRRRDPGATDGTLPALADARRLPATPIRQRCRSTSTSSSPASPHACSMSPRRRRTIGPTPRASTSPSPPPLRPGTSPCRRWRRSGGPAPGYAPRPLPGTCATASTTSPPGTGAASSRISVAAEAGSPAVSHLIALDASVVGAPWGNGAVSYCSLYAPDLTAPSNRYPITAHTGCLGKRLHIGGFGCVGPLKPSPSAGRWRRR